jgi:hypothetical protein
MRYSQDENGIKQFIKDTIGERISEKTILFKDLGLIGYDADLFIDRFSNEFEIDMTDFIFDNYFIQEYTVPFLYWFDIFFSKTKMKRKEFGIKHLLKIVQEKKWINI